MKAKTQQLKSKAVTSPMLSGPESCRTITVDGLLNCPEQPDPATEAAAAVKIQVTPGYSYLITLQDGCISYGIDDGGTLYGTRLRIRQATDANGTNLTGAYSTVGYGAYNYGPVFYSCDDAKAIGFSAPYNPVTITANDYYLYFTPDDVYGGWCGDNSGSESVQVCEMSPTPTPTITPTINPLLLLQNIQQYYMNVSTIAGVLEKNVSYMSMTATSDISFKIKRDTKYLKNCISGCWFERSFDGATYYTKLSDGSIQTRQDVSVTASAEDIILILENPIFFKPYDAYENFTLTLQSQNNNIVVLNVSNNNGYTLLYVDTNINVITDIQNYTGTNLVSEFTANYGDLNNVWFPTAINNTYYYAAYTLRENYVYSSVIINQPIDDNDFILEQ